MQGLGLFPLGLAPLGFGAPESGPEVAPLPSGIRAFDPSTGEYVTDANGAPVHTSHAAGQRMLIALKTDRESVSGLPNFGMRKVTLKRDGFEREHEQNVREALAHITDIRIDAVEVPKAPRQQVETNIPYTPLTREIR